MRSNPPPRRSRRAPDGDTSLPIVPILIGVIVLGFVIGAGLSLAGRHDMSLVAAASPSPIAPSTTVVPVTPAPTERPTPEPTDGPADTSTATPTQPPATPGSLASRAPAPQPKRSLPPHSIAPAAAAISVAPSIRTQPSVAPAAVASAKIGAGGAADATPSAAPPQASATVADFAQLSAAVVRQYIEAVKRGDEDSAYAALGSSPGSKGASLTEAGIIDSQTRVGRIDAHAAANDDTFVSVELQTASGPYYGQYTVHKTETGAAVIVAHSIVKP